MNPDCNTNTSQNQTGPLDWFTKMIPHCYDYATKASAQGKHIVGIMCEYTPREIILAADAVPVCLCGGSAEMIPPAEQQLPANLCPLIKSTYGYYLQKANPFLEMADLIVAETTCDGKKKMYELLARTKDIYVLELPQKADSNEALKYWKDELVRFKSFLEARFDTSITDSKLRRAIETMNRERRLRRQLADLMKSDKPPLTGGQLLTLKSSISGIETDLLQYESALKMYGKTEQSGNSQDNSRTRVLLTGVPTVHGAEKVVDIIESNGGLIVCMDNCTGLKPILDDIDNSCNDPIAAIAEKYFQLPCAVMTPNNKRLETIEKLVARYRPQCIVDLVWHACTTYDVESYKVKQLAEQRLNLPYMKIETDYSPSDSARIALRIEALFETVQQK
jgi:benzoyl-CoA reductase/2-hydroxyglutaryl-CoA dehydratase subunit BcrC/BadD/HgdB